MDKGLDVENPLYFMLFFEDGIKSTSSARSIYNEGFQTWYGQELDKNTWKLRPIVIFSITAIRFCTGFWHCSVLQPACPLPQRWWLELTTEKYIPQMAIFLSLLLLTLFERASWGRRSLEGVVISTRIMHFVIQVAPQSPFKAFLRSNHAKTKMQRVKFSTAQQLVRTQKPQSIFCASIKPNKPEH